jgi:DNA primase
MRHNNLEAAKAVSILAVAQRLGIQIKANKALCYNGHDRKTPSLSFNLRGNYYHCFGCGEGGDTVKLVMRVRGCTTGEAIRWILNDIEHAQPESERRQRHETEREHVRDYHDAYEAFLSLLDDSEAIEYLQRRSIPADITRQAGIRTLPREQDTITRAMLDQYDADTLRGAGLLDRSQRLTLARNRLIIPYRDRAGRIVNLQGRNIDDDTGTRYRFLPGRPVTLYNLPELGSAETVYLAEGVIDCLSLKTLGFVTPIAVPGVSSFRGEYYELLKAYRIIVASDADAAGRLFYLRLKQGFAERGKLIERLDYDRLRRDAGITAQTHDINELLQSANLRYSDTIGDHYIAGPENIRFRSGVTYTRNEAAKLKGIDPDTIRIAHILKHHTQGVIV